MLDLLNRGCTILVDALMSALLPLSPLGALCVIAAVAGALATLAFKYVSPQRRIQRVADRTRANLLAMRLFMDDLGVSLRAIGGLFGAALQRLTYSLPPLVVLLVPFLLLLTQLAMWFEFAPARVGQIVVVDVEIAPEAWNTLSTAELRPPPGVELVGPAARAARVHRITWRVRATQPVDAALRWEANGTAIAEKHLRVVDALADVALRPVSPKRPGASWVDQLLYPREAAFGAGSPVRSITIQPFDAGRWPVLGLAAPWWLTFFVVSIVAALVVKPFVGVQF